LAPALNDDVDILGLQRAQAAAERLLPACERVGEDGSRLLVGFCELADERSEGVLDVATLRGLRGAAVRTAGQLRDYLSTARAGGTRVLAYGAASRAVALLNLAGLDERLLPGVADVSPAKWGRRMPGTRIPVITPAELVERSPDVVLVLLPELLPEARAGLPGIERAGGRWVEVGTLGPVDRTDDLAPSAWSAS